MLTVTGGKEQGDIAACHVSAQFRQYLWLALAQGSQFGPVAGGKFRPLVEFMTEPAAQFSGGCDLLQPVIEGGFFPAHAPGPQAIHQHTPAVVDLGGGINPFDEDRHDELLGVRIAQTTCGATCWPECSFFRVCTAAESSRCQSLL